MNDEKIVRATVLDDGKTYQYMPDGSLVPIKSQTDWDRVRAMTDEDIEKAVQDDPDAAPLMTEEEFKRGSRVEPAHVTQSVLLDLDRDVVEHFRRASKKGFKARINAALRDYIQRQANKKAG